jgi:uncharacterized metal-binding protein YceD (DUF177 family)
MAIKFNIGSITEGEHKLEIYANGNEIGLNKGLLKDNLLIKANFYKTLNQLDMKLTLEGTYLLECDRCMEIYEFPFRKEFELVFVQKHEREQGYEDDTIRTFSPHLKTIDITKDIKDFVLLSIPMKKLPPEKADGSCSWCGKSEEYWKKFIKQNTESLN